MSMITLYDSSGFFTQSYDLQPGDTPSPPVGGGYVAGGYDGEQYYYLTGVATVRPSVTDEVLFTIHSDNTETVVVPSSGNLPTGTVVTDYETGTTYTAGASETFQFKSQINGEWKFLLEPPFPYKETEITVRADAY